MSRPVLPLLVASAGLCAQAPPGYWAAVDPTSAATLRQTLHAVIDDHLRLPYTSSATDTWDVLELADEDPANTAAIVDVYRNGSYTKIGGGIGPYNREHAWPKSYGFPVDGAGNYPFTDCHALFLCDAGYNSARSNRAFASADPWATELPTLFTNGRGGGSGVHPGNSNWTDAAAGGRWETWGHRRGDVARALFYLDVRYEGGTHGVTNAAEPDLVLTDDVARILGSHTGQNLPVAWMGRLATLLHWHDQDPVDARERRRNDVVFAFQGNRNPFVDHPEWVACLFGGNCGDTTPPAPPTLLFGIGRDGRVILDWADNTEPDLRGYHVHRAAASGGPYQQLTANPLLISAFTNTGLQNGTTWWFVVTAVDTSGNVSAPGNEASAVPQGPPPVWINELHYENAGVDRGEFVELAGPAGTILSGWTLIGYNGADGAMYASLPLGGTIPHQQAGLGTVAFAMALQNGAPDGVALVDPTGAVVEFLSYEGVLVALNGPAAGRTSTPIPTRESETTPIRSSLQLQGFGNDPGDFVWSVPLAATPRAPNVGQGFGDR